MHEIIIVCQCSIDLGFLKLKVCLQPPIKMNGPLLSLKVNAVCLFNWMEMAVCFPNVIVNTFSRESVWLACRGEGRRVAVEGGWLLWVGVAGGKRGKTKARIVIGITSLHRSARKNPHSILVLFFKLVSKKSPPDYCIILPASVFLGGRPGRVVLQNCFKVILSIFVYCEF